MSENENDTEDLEGEARKLGWAPRDKWRGKAEEFVEAGEFLRRGREVLPIVRSQVDQTRAENEKLRQELAATRADFDRRVKTTERMTERLLQQQQAQMVAEFEEKKRAAAATGDAKAYDAVVRQEQTAIARAADVAKEAAKDTAPPPQGQQPPPEVQEWSKKNEWFFRDRPLAMEAEALHVALLQEQPGLSLADNLERVTETIKQRYPQKFGGQQQASTRERGFSAVEGGSSSSRVGASSRERGWKELPSEARAACEQMLRNGRLKGDPKKVQESYARTYWEEYGE